MEESCGGSKRVSKKISKKIRVILNTEKLEIPWGVDEFYIYYDPHEEIASRVVADSFRDWNGGIVMQCKRKGNNINEDLIQRYSVFHIVLGRKREEAENDSNYEILGNLWIAIFENDSSVRIPTVWDSVHPTT